LLGLLFDLKDRASAFLQNVGELLPDYILNLKTWKLIYRYCHD
jgi:hypothetical protein